MNTRYEGFKNIAAQKGRIDPATVEHAERAIELSDKIEYWFASWQNAYEDVTKNNSERLVRLYAKRYKEHTGEYYIR